MFNNLKLAIQFLTVFNAGKTKEGPKADDIAKSVVFFPVAGLLLGLICAVSYNLIVYLTDNHLAASVFPVFLLGLLTRGLHLDGIADTFDAMHFAKYDKKKALEVMKDNAVGAFGASALILLILGKFIFIYSIPYESIFGVLVVIPVISRWTPSVVARYTSPASGKGLGYTFTGNVTTEYLIISTIITAVISVLFLGLPGIVLFISAVIFTSLITWYFNSLFGGTTGDIYGSVIELSELFGFLAAIVILK